MNRNTQEKLQREIQRRASNYQTCFSTEAGKAVLAELERIYCKSSIFSNDALVMARNAAQYDLVTDIKNMIQAAGEGDHD